MGNTWTREGHSLPKGMLLPGTQLRAHSGPETRVQRPSPRSPVQPRALGLGALGAAGGPCPRQRHPWSCPLPSPGKGLQDCSLCSPSLGSRETHPLCLQVPKGETPGPEDGVAGLYPTWTRWFPFYTPVFRMVLLLTHLLQAAPPRQCGPAATRIQRSVPYFSDLGPVELGTLVQM